MTRIFSTSFQIITELDEYLNKLRTNLNTKLLPRKTGGIESLIAYLTKKIYYSSIDTQECYESISFELNYNWLRIFYVSKGDTEIEIRFYIHEEEETNELTIDINYDYYKDVSKKLHKDTHDHNLLLDYEAITKALYYHNFIRTNINEDVNPPVYTYSYTKPAGINLRVPTWALNRMSNNQFSRNKMYVNQILVKRYNLYPTVLPGYLCAWSDLKGNYIAYSGDESLENRLAIIKSSDIKLPVKWYSYRELLILLRQQGTNIFH